MITPYDWQEGIGNRAQYIEGKLKLGSPVLAVSIEAGIVAFTMRRQTRKIFEVYDRLLFSAVGQQSDVEAIRSAAVEFAHQEGYNRSEQDVTIQRVVTALSASVKKAFSDFSTAPLVARSLFAEVAEHPDKDLFYDLDYDGDYSISNRFGLAIGNRELTETVSAEIEKIPLESTPEEAVQNLKSIWRQAISAEDEPLDDLIKDLVPEAMLLERSNAREDRFRLLTVS